MHYAKWVFRLAVLSLTFMALLILSFTVQVQDTPTKGVSYLIDRSNHFIHEIVPSPYPYKIPFIDRSILAKLDAIERHELPIRISDSSYLHSAGFQRLLEICQNRTTPCRFLLATRIAEQESKARQHLIGLTQLAAKLDRILVLPNAGKSRLGLCTSWTFETYYHSEAFVDLLRSRGTEVTDLKSFLSWIFYKTQQSSPSSAQIVSLTSGSRQLYTSEPVTYLHQDVEVSLYPRHIVSYSDFPYCLEAQLPGLNLDAFAPILIQLQKGKRLVGDSIVAALRSEDFQKIAFIKPNESNSSLEPDILLIDWGLRHPLFPPSMDDRVDYSPNLVQLAKHLGPSDPYLAIHWRMESVPPEFLPDCAHSLVHLLSSTLQNPALSDGIQTIWFASDYPYPISSLSPDLPAITSTMISKSSTFRDFGPKHTEAIQILLDAFRPSGELDKFKITDLHQARNGLDFDVGGGFEGSLGLRVGVDPDVLQDSGVLGIVDKLVGMEAAFFVSGAKGCGRASSFTKQIIDAREKGNSSRLRNVVDFFW
ncbi:hypothetical protein VKT23_005411 [Stygiomarasmius scandens]|uniref:Uncharacterized protein n=1 Tax=Marasmiellus scandens TaxID=2682957 RepID=A0ABR1JWE4_9AGAR